MGTAYASRSKGDAAERRVGAATEPNGLQKAAILILSMDEEAAARVLRGLSDTEAELITREIARLGIVEKDRVAQVLAEFGELTKVEELRRLEAQERSAPFAFLKSARSGGLHALLQDEQPQAVALVLSYLEPEKAADVLGKLPSGRQLDIVRRIAHLARSSPEAIQHVESGVRKHLSSLAVEDLKEAGGAGAVARILGAIDGATGKDILEGLDEDSPELAEEIRKLMPAPGDIAQDGKAAARGRRRGGERTV